MNSKSEPVAASKTRGHAKRERDASCCAVRIPQHPRGPSEAPPRREGSGRQCARGQKRATAGSCAGPDCCPLAERLRPPLDDGRTAPRGPSPQARPPLAPSPAAGGLCPGRQIGYCSPDASKTLLGKAQCRFATARGRCRTTTTGCTLISSRKPQKWIFSGSFARPILT